MEQVYLFVCQKSPKNDETKRYILTTLSVLLNLMLHFCCSFLRDILRPFGTEGWGWITLGRSAQDRETI